VVNHVVTIFERCAAKSIECGSRRGLQFDTANTEAALFTCSPASRKRLRPKLRANILVAKGIIQFNMLATRWLDVWMDVHPTFKEQRN
jgi:hypothetical protein